MSENPRPLLYDAMYRMAPAEPSSGSSERVTIVGRHCESGDVLVPEQDLPVGVRPGDLLAMATTGAYTYSLASTYNRFGRPAVVGVRSGRADLWLRRELADDMDRLEPGSSGAEARGAGA
jgi:diaminopimelate decarboxylase